MEIFGPWAQRPEYYQRPGRDCSSPKGESYDEPLLACPQASRSCFLAKWSFGGLGHRGQNTSHSPAIDVLFGLVSFGGKAKQHSFPEMCGFLAFAPRASKKPWTWRDASKRCIYSVRQFSSCSTKLVPLPRASDRGAGYALSHSMTLETK